MNGAIKREQGESFASFSARQKAAQAAASKPPKARKPRRPSWYRQGDIIDGYDRDDLGESPDY